MTTEILGQIRLIKPDQINKHLFHAKIPMLTKYPPFPLGIENGGLSLITIFCYQATIILRWIPQLATTHHTWLWF